MKNFRMTFAALALLCFVAIGCDAPNSGTTELEPGTHVHADGTVHSNDAHDHDHDHDHEDSKKHHISVDVFTELADVVRWLPKIASDGDLPQKEWKQAKALSEEMSEHLETIGTGLPTVQRTNYQSDSSSMEKWIGELESIVKSTSSMSK